MASQQVDIRDLSALKDGWNGPSAKAPTEEALRVASAVSFVPSMDGGIQVELHAGGLGVEISIEPDGAVDVWVGRAR